MTHKALHFEHYLKEAFHLSLTYRNSDEFKNKKATLRPERGRRIKKYLNTGRCYYSALANRHVSIYWLGFYVLILLPSLWVIAIA